jgi:hypothetical protein
MFRWIALALILVLAACGGSPVASPSPGAAAQPPASTAASAPTKPGAPAAGSSEVQRLTRVGGFLTATIDALNKNDLAGARKAFADFDDGWSAIEVYVKARSEKLYRDIEDVQDKVDKQFESASPNPKDIVPQVQQIQASYNEAITLAQAGPAPNPVLGKLAGMREVRLPLRHAVAALKKNDVATAQREYAEFDKHWDDVEDYVKDKSRDMYREVEDRMSQVSAALLKQQSPSASQVLPLAEALLAKYNDALRLVGEGASSA